MDALTITNPDHQNLKAVIENKLETLSGTIWTLEAISSRATNKDMKGKAPIPMMMMTTKAEIIAIEAVSATLGASELPRFIGR